MELVTKTKDLIKKYGLVIATFIASHFSGIAQTNAEVNAGHKTDSIADVIENIQGKENNDSIFALHPDSLINDVNVPNSSNLDSIPAAINNICADTIPTDSATLMQYRIDKFNQSSENMVKFLSLFENIKSKAYYDNVAKCYSIGLGFCYRKDGTRIKANDRIKNEEDLFGMWEFYADKHYLPQMLKYFKLETLTEEEKIAITSLMFNCGPGIIGSTNGYKPTPFTKAFNKWKETGDEQSLNIACEYIKSKNKSRGKIVPALTKRRKIEEELIRGNILIDKEQATLQGKAFLNLDSVVVGAFYSVGKFPSDMNLLMEKVSAVDGKTYSDTLRVAFPVSAVLNQKKYRK